MEEATTREEIVMLAAMLASEASPAEASAFLRAGADDLDGLQPTQN